MFETNAPSFVSGQSPHPWHLQKFHALIYEVPPTNCRCIFITDNAPFVATNQPRTITNLCYLPQTEWWFYGPKCALRLVFIRRVSAHDFLRTWFIGSKRVIKSDHLVEGTSGAGHRDSLVFGSARLESGPRVAGGGRIAAADDAWLFAVP